MPCRAFFRLILGTCVPFSGYFVPFRDCSVPSGFRCGSSADFPQKKFRFLFENPFDLRFPKREIYKFRCEKLIELSIFVASRCGAFQKRDLWGISVTTPVATKPYILQNYRTRKRLQRRVFRFPAGSVIAACGRLRSRISQGFQRR